MDNRNLFENRLKQLGIGRQVDAAMVVARSQKVINNYFGTRGEENLRAVSYKKGTLKIASTSSAWSAECQKIIVDLKQKPVERVIFTLGLDNINQD